MTTALAYPSARLRYVTRGIQAGVDFAAADLATEPVAGLTRYVRTTDIQSVHALKSAGVYAPTDQVPDTAIAREGDLLVTRAGSLGTAYLHSGPPVAVAGYLVRCQFDARAEPRFYAYFCQSVPFADALRVGATQTTIENFSASKYADLVVPVPPLDTQRRIADMLDAKTARIDTLIEKNERMVTSLAQRVKSLRAELLWPRECVQAWSGDPLAAPTSSVRESTRLQYVVPTRVAGGTPTSSNENYWTDASNRGVAWFAIGDLRHGSVSSEPSRRVSNEGMTAAGLTVMPVGTIAYAMYASIGKTSRLLVDGVTNQAILSLVPGDRLLPDYLLEWLVFTQPFAESRARSNTQGNLNADQVARFSIRVPSMAEQRSIARELLDAEAQVAALRTKVDRQQELLRLRRQALITAAVTGEIEV